MMFSDYKREVFKTLQVSLGHRKHTQDGVSGIFMPARSIPNPPPPSMWKIRRVMSSGTKKQAVLARENTMNPGMDDDEPESASVVETSFAEAKAAMTGKDYLKRLASAAAQSQPNRKNVEDCGSDDEALAGMDGLRLLTCEFHLGFLLAGPRPAFSTRRFGWPTDTAQGPEGVLNGAPGRNSSGRPALNGLPRTTAVWPTSKNKLMRGFFQHH